MRPAALVTALALLMGPTAGVADAQPRLFLHVTDQRGVIVTDLRSDEIVVRENGRLREVVSARLANLPLKITVLVDNSQAAGSASLHLREALKQFFRDLPPNQLISLLTVSGQPRWVVRPTTDLTELLDGADRIVPRQGRATRFLDALIEATGRVAEDEEPHRAIVVSFTAVGRDNSTFTQRRYENFLRQVIEAGVTFHTVQLSLPVRQATLALQTQITQDLQRLTGGYRMSIAAPSAVDDGLEAIMAAIDGRNRDLARQVKVEYVRPDGEDEPLDEISVELLRPGLAFAVSLDGRLQ